MEVAHLLRVARRRAGLTLRPLAERDGQVRLWWDRTPGDLYFRTTEFHDEALSRVRHEPFLG